MKNVAEFRAQAALCRQLAICNSKTSNHWLAQAERWSRLAQDAISSHYEECNGLQLNDAHIATTSCTNVQLNYEATAIL
jgi:hypothetical protein